MNNLFGTDGIRAQMGQSPFTQHELIRLGRAIAKWIEKKYGANCQLLIASDTRISVSFVKAAIKAGLLLHSIKCADAGTLPTPALLKVMKEANQFDIGIMISASHNPYHDNGIKIIDRRNGKLDLADERAISALYKENNNAINYHQLGSDYFFSTGNDLYLNALKKKFPKNYLQNFKVVLDCANGATFQLAPTIFEHFGANVIALNTKPNGTNINENCGAVHPKQLQHEVLKHNADIGFAFDGDGDRVIAINKDGQVKDGDDLLALLSCHEQYKNEQHVVATIMSNYGLEIFVEQQNKSLVRSAVGDKHVARHMLKYHTSIGGEQSGHIILQDFLSMGDGIFAALRIAETMIISKNWELNSFKRFPQLLINIPVQEKKDLHAAPLDEIITKHKAKLHNGRLIVRYSGTENMLRIMIEDENKKYAQMVGKTLVHALQKELQ